MGKGHGEHPAGGGDRFPPGISTPMAGSNLCPLTSVYYLRLKILAAASLATTPYSHIIVSNHINTKYVINHSAENIHHLPGCPRRRGTQGRDTSNTADEPCPFVVQGLISSRIFLYICYITPLPSTSFLFSPLGDALKSSP